MLPTTRPRRDSQSYRRDYSRNAWQPKRYALVRRVYRSTLLRLLLASVLLWSVIDAVVVHYRYGTSGVLYRRLGPGEHRLFIASIHWNNEAILRSHWNDALLTFMSYYGRNDTYYSIQESGSWDDSKGALRELHAKLQERKYPGIMILDPTTHLDEILKPPTQSGWIYTSRGKTELRRIPYLSKLRNLVLEPLYEQAREGIFYDKIIFLNDVIFTPWDIEELMSTNGGEYAAACAMDFSKPPGFYDTFALRDSDGNNKLMKTWPYFRSAASRDAMKARRPVPVKSCWNGVVIMDAKPFYESKLPLQFRGVSDSLAEHHVEGSECCLIHADNPLTASKGVWVNPDVRVAYNAEAHKVVNNYGSPWMSLWTIWTSLWKNRMLRWTTTQYFRDRIVNRRLRLWKSESAQHVEPGTACLVNEMQVLVENGWAHV